MGLRDAEGARAKATFRVFADSVPAQDICACLQPAAYLGTVEVVRSGASSDHQKQAGRLFQDIEIPSLPAYGVKPADEGQSDKNRQSIPQEKMSIFLPLFSAQKVV